MPHSLSDMARFVPHLVTPSKQVEDSDEQLKRAQTLFEERRAVMDPHNCALAESLLQHCGDLRDGFEDKRLPNRIKQARLYCAAVDKTLQKIQAIADGADDARARGATP